MTRPVAASQPKPMSRKISPARAIPAAIILAIASCFTFVGIAHADGMARCSKPSKPDAGTGWVDYEGTATCAYGDTTGLATVRAKLQLRQGNGARFRPDTWYTIDQTSYTPWFSYAGSYYRGGSLWCSDVPYSGDFRGRFYYQLHWTDDHQTNHTWQSDTVDSNC